MEQHQTQLVLKISSSIPSAAILKNFLGSIFSSPVAGQPEEHAPQVKHRLKLPPSGSRSLTLSMKILFFFPPSLIASSAIGKTSIQDVTRPPPKRQTTILCGDRPEGPSLHHLYTVLLVNFNALIFSAMSTTMLENSGPMLEAKVTNRSRSFGSPISSNMR